MLDAQRFAEMLRKCRVEKNLTQSELAQKLFVTPQSISKWERGEGMPDLENLCALAESLSVSLDALLGRRENGDRTFIGIQFGSFSRCVLINEKGVVLKSVALSDNGAGTRGVQMRVELLRRGIDQLRPAAMNTRAIYVISNQIENTLEEINLQHTLLRERYPGIKIDCGGLLPTLLACGGVPAQRALLAVGGRMNTAIYRLCGEQYVRTGRGGFLARPNGSYYNIGNAALIAACEEDDEIGEKTLLTPLLLQWFSTDRIKSALPKLLHGKPGYIATLAGLVNVAAEKGDKVALQILRDCSADLAKLIRTAHKRTPEADHVVLSSSLFTAQSDIYYELVRERLEPEIKVVRLTTSLEWEACLRAAKLCGAEENLSLELFAKSGLETDYGPGLGHDL